MAQELGFLSSIFGIAFHRIISKKMGLTIAAASKSCAALPHNSGRIYTYFMDIVIISY